MWNGFTERLLWQDRNRMKWNVICSLCFNIWIQIKHRYASFHVCLMNNERAICSFAVIEVKPIFQRALSIFLLFVNWYSITKSLGCWFSCEQYTFQLRLKGNMYLFENSVLNRASHKIVFLLSSCQVSAEMEQPRIVYACCFVDSLIFDYGINNFQSNALSWW